MFKKLVKTLYISVGAVLIVQLAGCGTLMYPERRGQTSGRIDAGVAVMDGLCLLLFIVPGVIAYAVDFSNGTIYLPHTSRGCLDIKDIKQVKFDPKHYNDATIERIVKEETGFVVKLSQGNVKIYRFKSVDEMIKRFTDGLPEMKSDRIALNME